MSLELITRLLHMTELCRDDRAPPLPAQLNWAVEHGLWMGPKALRVVDESSYLWTVSLAFDLDYSCRDRSRSSCVCIYTYTRIATHANEHTNSLPFSQLLSWSSFWIARKSFKRPTPQSCIPVLQKTRPKLKHQSEEVKRAWLVPVTTIKIIYFHTLDFSSPLHISQDLSETRSLPRLCKNPQGKRGGTPWYLD